MRRSIAALVFIALAPGLAAAQAKTYAVLSLVGDRLMLVTREMSTGSRIDKNTRQFLELPGPDLDRTVLRAVDDSLRAQAADAQVVLLETRDPAVFKAQSKALDEGGGASSILPAVREIASGSKATHLVLVTKQRHEAMLRVDEGHVGSGSLEGVGFYIDRAMPITDRASGDRYVGFLAPFAYFRISLIDLASGKVLGEELVYASQTRGNQSSVHPWDALDPQQKVAALQQMLGGETARVMPGLLKARQALP